MIILKEEINTAMNAVLELTKWKLIILAVLTTAGLGTMQGFEHFNYGYLLLLIAPYVCAYVDLLVYERESRVHYIARYLRQYEGDDAECRELRQYEEYIHNCRMTTVWVPHENRARLASSVVLSVGIPLLTWPVAAYRAIMQQYPSLVLIPLIGLGFVIYAYVQMRIHLDKIDKPAPTPPQEHLKTPR